MSPTISVIMPAFNAAQHIRQSIQSVLEQTFDDWELIVVDDGSTDETATVAGSFSDSRIRCVRRENGGQAAARNTGIVNSHGEFIAFLDADDLWLPTKLERQMEVLRRTGADVVCCDGYMFVDDRTFDVDFFAIVPGLTDGATMLRLLFRQNRIAILAAIVKRESIERVGLFDESRRFQNCEDYDLWLSLARAGNTFYGMSDKLVRYRRHPSSTTYRQSNLLRPAIEVLKKHSGAVDLKTARQQIRTWYRELITALIAENDLAGARAAMREFVTWDRGGIVTLLQRIVLRLFPSRFLKISGACLYPAEWHLARYLAKLKHRPVREQLNESSVSSRIP